VRSSGAQAIHAAINRRQQNIYLTLDGTPQAADDGCASACCDLTFDLLTRKSNQYVFWPRFFCDLILVQLALIVTKILYSLGFSGHLPAVTLTFDPNI